MIALFAGRGRLPELLDRTLRAQGEAVLICALEGQPPDGLGRTADLTYRLETLGKLLADLSSRGVTRVCLAGALTRPQFDPALVDAATQPLVDRLRAALPMGDDGTLRAILCLFEEAGFEVVAATDILPALTLPSGVPTQTQPGAAAVKDMEIGLAEIARLGEADTGQGCLVRGGNVIAREGPDGTDAMIQDARAEGATLVKAAKPGQDRRADLPAIGPDTARIAAEAGLVGAIIPAGDVMVIDPAETVAAFDRAGLFLWVCANGAAP